jgi:nucleotide-binding universal stress UspA family protein
MSANRKQIVVAVDNSDNCFRALLAGAELARAMGRELALLYVFPYSPGASASMTGLNELSTEQLKEHKASVSDDIFKGAEAELAKKVPIAHKHLLVGDPAEEIINFMRDHPDTHLVMGRRGLSKIKALVLGSVSDKVTRYAPGLVTVVS